MSTEDPGVIKQLLDWAWAGVLALGGLVYKKHNEEMGELKEALHSLRNKVVGKDEYRDRNELVDKLLEDRRIGEREVYREMGELRREVTKGFSDLKDLLISKK